jgi:hypothetical protein
MPLRVRYRAPLSALLNDALRLCHSSSKWVRSVGLLVYLGVVSSPLMELSFCLHFLCYSTVLYRLPGGCGLQRR